MASTAPPLLIIFGPTASGKSALAERLAEDRGGVIINADSQQLYGELRALTARPDTASEARLPHRLYGVLAGDDPASAGRWLALAVPAIRECWESGRLPIVVGGTGLYLKALMDGLSPIPAIDPAIRAHVTAMREELGAQDFHARLAACDPVLAARLHAGDTQRVIRAMEVFEATGKPLSHWQSLPPQPPLPEADFTLIRHGLDMERAELYARCDARFDAMLEQGALEEVKRLIAKNYPVDAPIMKIIGVPELAAYLRGNIALDEAAARAKQATRNYAKRQLTWLRNQFLET